MKYRPMIAWGIPLLAVMAGVGLALRDTEVADDEVRVPWSDPLVERDVDAIRKDTLRVLVIEDPLTWEVRPKAVSGLEHDLLRRFAAKAGLPVVFLPMHHPDSMLLALQRGEGDVIAAQWSPRKEQREWVGFTEPYRYVRPMLAMLREDPIPIAPGTPVLRSTTDTVELSIWSPFVGEEYTFDPAFSRGTRMHVDPAVWPEEQLMSVVMGRHHAAIVTDARVAYEAGRFPVLEFTGPLGEARPLCFVVRRNASMLLNDLNAWLGQEEEKEAREQFIAAYGSKVKGPGALKARSGIPVTGDSISPFDEAFRQHAAGARWGWELLAAMAFKESRFDSTVVSSKGAQGIMQIMPRTGAKLGLDSTAVVSDHIRAAARYLAKLDTMWMRQVTDREQRLRFVLASYNAGPGHIIDAQRLAARLELDPARWEHNVERAVLLLAKPRYYMEPGMKNGYCKGSQVFHYVRDVTAMYAKLKARKPAPALAEAKPRAGSPE